MPVDFIEKIQYEKFGKVSYSTSNYQKLISSIVSSPVLENILYENVMKYNLDIYAEVFASVFNKYSLKKLFEFLDADLKATTNPATALRGTTFGIRLLTKIMPELGLNEFIVDNFKKFLSKICAIDLMPIEIDPRKITDEGLLQSNIQRLTQFCTEFLDHLFSQSVIDAIPMPVRQICRMVANSGAFLYNDEVPLICGIFILRFLIPAIINPEKIGLKKLEIVELLPSHRRNLILVCKVVQLIANGITKENEVPEAYMVAMSDFADNYRVGMRRLLLEVANVSMDVSHGLISSNDVYWLPQVSSKNLQIFHYLVLRNCQLMLNSALSTDAQSSTSNQFFRARSVLDFIQAIEKTGPLCFPPGSNGYQALVEHLNLAEVSSELLPHHLAEQCRLTLWNVLLMKDCQNYTWIYDINCEMELVQTDCNSNGNADVTSPCMVRARTNSFFFNTSVHEISPSMNAPFADYPVVYVILSDLKQMYNQIETDELMSFFVHKMDKYRKEPFVLVIDSSCINAENGMNRREYLFGLISAIPETLFNNIQMTLLIQPIVEVERFIIDLLPFSVVSLPDYRLCADYLTPTQISFPINTKLSNPMSFEVFKINKRGAAQQRILKLTRDSILNIHKDTIQNEILLCQLTDVCRVDDNELHLHFNGRLKDLNDGYFSEIKDSYFLKDSKREEVRIYRFFNKFEREVVVEFIEDLLNDLPQLSMTRALQSFDVIKINDKGKKQKRLMRLSTDSIYNVNGKDIKWEKPLITIESVEVLQNNNVRLKFATETMYRQFETPLSQQVVKSIRDNITYLKKRNGVVDDTNDVSSELQTMFVPFG
eukprot:TRINITY_DN1815_c0_g1_i1.p1 TRINITY_DN1815_c0_g1~~TRINITY_DN1815_c0_g1_i1.p1  ORF type:complete len:824 (+),score=167.04 TRINITY_DN1815_c0_g1_i1:32-2503(+)